MESLMGGSGYYGNDVACLPIAKAAHQPTLRQRLAAAVTQAEERLKAVKEAQEIFDRNPDVERLLDLMQRSHF